MLTNIYPVLPDFRLLPFSIGTVTCMAKKFTLIEANP